MKRLVFLLLIPILMWMFCQGPVVVLAYSDNPQQEIVKVQQDYQKWVQENAPKMQQDVQKAQREGKPYEAQKIAIKWQYDVAMKAIEMQEKIADIQKPRR